MRHEVRGNTPSPAPQTRGGELLIDDIGTLAAVPPGPLRGSAMGDWPLLRDAALLIRDGRIAWFGPRREAPRTAATRVWSAGGGTLIPGLIDAHTHIPFAGDRSAEFVRRVAGESYLQILESGGGIRVTVGAVRAAEQSELVAINAPRLQRMLQRGVTTVECKSGYGLSAADELKQLLATRDLQATTPLELVPTYLGAHATPAEFHGRPDDFLNEIGAPSLLERIVREKLAEFVDVFCDRGAFTTEQSRRYLLAGKQAGLAIKLHADELAQIGASRLAGELGAVSADHLELIDDAGIAALREAGTIAMVLPGTSFFLGIHHADARRMIAGGLAVGLATDFNPGSSHVDSLPFVMHIACCQLRMTPREVIAAVTANAAAALRREARLGAIAVGHDADLTLLNTPTLDWFFYEPARDHVAAVFKRGRRIDAPGD
ncbi:MAG: imidazolonepropionase [Phycisphaerae bacterium]|nr:imidazolonepropionase [Phycisphaerae bacterium]